MDWGREDNMPDTHTTKVERMATARIPTGAGEFQLSLYFNNQDDKEHLAFAMGDLHGKTDVLVRVHSECFTGDVLGSRRCDCGEQLERAMQLIAEKGSGVIIYLRQEGRGIGLLNKLRAYNLQDQGYDTIDANLALGHQVDERDYTVAARILDDLGVHSIRLMTNNPGKIHRLEELGVEVTERVALESTIYADNYQYLFTKALRMNHMINLDAFTLVDLEHKSSAHG
jgi:GTP cyclohydrolase II